MAKRDPYVDRVARAIADSLLREQLQKEAKADSEAALARLTYEAGKAQLRKAGA